MPKFLGSGATRMERPNGNVDPFHREIEVVTGDAAAHSVAHHDVECWPRWTLA